MLLSFQLYAQHLNGIAVDRISKLPVANANVSTALLTVFTSAVGKFSLTNLHFGDTIKITCIGYKPYKLILDTAESDTIHIYLDQSPILLKDVIINGIRDFKKDSIRNRKQFASIFAYKSRRLTDIFTTKSPYSYVPYSSNTASNNTTSIISLDLLSLADLLTKNGVPASRLQKAMLKEEENNYVEHVFSKIKVSIITSLKGDSLQDFMDQYKPSIQAIKKMTDYGLILYIKKSYTEFIKSYKHENHSPFNK